MTNRTTSAGWRSVSSNRATARMRRCLAAMVGLHGDTSRESPCQAGKRADRPAIIPSSIHHPGAYRRPIWLRRSMALMSGGGSSHCRHPGTALSAPPGCGYNANPKIPADGEEAGRGRKLHRRVHHVLRWAVDDRRWLWTAPKSLSGSVGSATVGAAGREAFQMDGTAVDFDRDSARVRGAILEQFQEKCVRFSREKRVALSLEELLRNKEIERFTVSVKR